MIKSSVKGTLIPIGGNEDKGTRRDESSQLNFVQKSILARVIRECKRPDPLIVVVPTASSIPVEVGEKYREAFGQFDYSNVHVLDIRNRAQTGDTSSLEWIERADCVMFSRRHQPIQNYPHHPRYAYAPAADGALSQRRFCDCRHQRRSHVYV